MVFSLKGAQGPAGPQGPPGPPGLKAIADPVKAADVVSSQSIFLNRLASTVINNPNLTKNISEQIIRFPSSISNNLADNKMFQNIIANNVVSNSSIIGKTVADKIMSDPINTKELSTSLGSQGNLLLQLSENLSNPSLPYASYLKGPSGQIANLNTSLQPIGLLCDTTGNCTTPKFGSYLNYTNGNLLFQNNRPPNNFNDFHIDYYNNNITLFNTNKVIINRFYKGYYNNYLETTHYGKLYENNEVYYKNIQIMNNYKFLIYPNKNNFKFLFNIIRNILIVKRMDMNQGWNNNLKVLIIDKNHNEYLITVGNSDISEKHIEINI